MVADPPVLPRPPSARLPAGLIDRARRLARGALVPTEPRPAATVVLLRPAPAGPEAYLLRRVRSMAFAAGMYVFPGGTVDIRDDGLPARAWSGPEPSTWAALLAADESLARGLVCAAVRETFEESGVLLAGPTADRVVEDTRGDDWEADRLALIDRSLGFAEFLDRRRLVLRTDLLGPWAHWITPEAEERRYDTRFFVAALPVGQRTRDVSGEADRVAWTSPAAAVAAFRRGELGMLPPTVVTLDELSRFRDVPAVLAAATGREMRQRLPRVVLGGSDEEAWLELPGDHRTGAAR